jgi:septum formation protein
VIVLASGSPRRRELISRLDVPFTVVSSGVNERKPRAGEDAEAFARELALEKATAVHTRYSGATVLAADTVVTIDGAILGKPDDAADAFRMLCLLRGRVHTVVTAVATWCPGCERPEAATRATLVSMVNAPDEVLRAYIATGEPMDKAGSYAIQGPGGALVLRIEGCYENVVGFPLCQVSALLARCGVTPGPNAERCVHRTFTEEWNPSR